MDGMHWRSLIEEIGRTRGGHPYATAMNSVNITVHIVQNLQSQGGYGPPWPLWSSATDGMGRRWRACACHAWGLEFELSCMVAKRLIDQMRLVLTRLRHQHVTVPPGTGSKHNEIVAPCVGETDGEGWCGFIFGQMHAGPIQRWIVDRHNQGLEGCMGFCLVWILCGLLWIICG